MLHIEANFGDWDVEGLRLSIFHSEDSFGSIPTGMWAKVIGSEPESVESRPRDRLVRETGGVNGNNFLLTTQPRRVDWLMQPVMTQYHPADEVLTLSDPEEVLSIIQRSLILTLESLPNLLRLAFGASLAKQVNDAVTGVEQVSKYIPELRFGSMAGVDFIYQVNRRRRSEVVSDVEINRLAKWSIQQFGSLHLQMGAAGQHRVQGGSAGMMRKLDLDINTAPETAVLHNSAVPSIFGELIGLAREISIDGDID